MKFISFFVLAMLQLTRYTTASMPETNRDGTIQNKQKLLASSKKLGKKLNLILA